MSACLLCDFWGGIWSVDIFSGNIGREEKNGGRVKGKS